MKKNSWPNSIFCNFKNGQKSIFELGKRLKLPKMQFHVKQIYLFDFTSFFAWTSLNFLARCCDSINRSITISRKKRKRKRRRKRRRKYFPPQIFLRPSEKNKLKKCSKIFVAQTVNGYMLWKIMPSWLKMGLT